MKLFHKNMELNSIGSSASRDGEKKILHLMVLLHRWQIIIMTPFKKMKMQNKKENLLREYKINLIIPLSLGI